VLVQHVYVPATQQFCTAVACICSHPLIPSSALSRCLRISQEQLLATTVDLINSGHILPVPTQPQQLTDHLWTAADHAVDAFAKRFHLHASYPRRYAYFRADHLRRLHHTLAVYAFWTAFGNACERRARQLVSTFELAAVESELTASDVYRLQGVLRYFRPDGLGLIRMDETAAPFWLEVDGTPVAPSRNDPNVWAGKFNRYCDYIVSERWRARYSVLPRILIVTTDLRILPHLKDALGFAARARRIDPPRVFVTAHTAVQQRGPLGKIWREVFGVAREFVYAFEGVGYASSSGVSSRAAAGTVALPARAGAASARDDTAGSDDATESGAQQ
jgi:hypothetical protein